MRTELLKENKRIGILAGDLNLVEAKQRLPDFDFDSVRLIDEEEEVKSFKEKREKYREKAIEKRKKYENSPKGIKEKNSRFYSKVKSRLVTGQEAILIDKKGIPYPDLSKAVVSVAESVKYSGSVDDAVEAVLKELNINS